MLRLAIIILLLSLASALSAAEPKLIPALSIEYVSEPAFTPDGKYVLFNFGNDYGVVWDRAAEKIICRLCPETDDGAKDWLNSIILSRDGTRALTCGGGFNCLWEIPSGKLLRRYKQPSRTYSIDFSPDGKSAMTSHADGKVRIWNLETEKIIQQFTVKDQQEARASFSPDGKYILTKNAFVACIWETVSGKLLYRYADDNNVYLWACAFSNDSKFLALATSLTKITIHNLERDEDAVTLNPNSSVNALKFSPDGKSLLVVSPDVPAMIMDIATDKVLSKITDRLESVHWAAFAPDGKSFVTCGMSDPPMFWETSTCKKLSQVPIFAHALNDAIWSPNGRYIVTRRYANRLCVWDLSVGREIYRVDGGTGIAFTHDSAAIISIGRQIDTFETATGKKLTSVGLFGQELNDDTGGMFPVNLHHVSRDGKILVIAKGCTTYFLDASTGKEIRHFDEPPHQRVDVVELSPDEKQVLIGTTAPGEAKPTFLLRNAESGKLLLTIPVDLRVECAAFSPDGKKIIASLSDEAARIFDASSGKEIDRLDTKDFILGCAFSPDGKTILTRRKYANLFDAATMKLRLNFIGHLGETNAAAFSPNGKYILTSSIDSTARIWDAATGKQLAALHSFTDRSWAVITPDNRYDTSDPKKNSNLHWVESDVALPLEKFAAKYHTPELLKQLIK